METTSTNEDRRLLKRYLSQYYRAKEKQAALRSRLDELQSELRHPGVSTPPLDGIPVKSKHHDGAIALIFKIDDIEERIQRQIDIEVRSVAEIMDVLDFLPRESTERDILEYRHIDCKPWTEIQRLVHLTRSPCFEYYNRGLDKLLEFKKVRATLAAFDAKLSRIEKDGH